MRKILGSLVTAALLASAPLASTFAMPGVALADLRLNQVQTKGVTSYTRKNYQVYAAIAVNEETGFWAWTTSYLSRSGAETAALNICGDDCVIAMSAYNQNSQYLSLFLGSNGRWGAARAETVSEVKDLAKSACEGGGISCSEAFTIRNIPDPSYSWGSDNLVVPAGYGYDPHYDYYFEGEYL